ncbi:unnamed protein product [Absidia cylindrospora]
MSIAINTSSSSGFFQDTCSQWTDCLSCVADSGCGYCSSLGKCIQGNWFGVINRSTDYCPVTDYYYKQCQFSSLPLGIMASFVLFVLLILVLVGLCYLCCCCACCCRSDSDEEERQMLLRGDRSRYLQRSSTYYQWNRAPPPSTTQFKHQPQPSHHQRPHSYLPPSPSPSNQHHHHHRRYGSGYSISPEDTVTSQDTWESRRSQLLKKYARDTPQQQTDSNGIVFYGQNVE